MNTSHPADATLRQGPEFPFGSGKGAGVVSVLCGWLGLGGVVALHFPEYLATPGARAAYLVDYAHEVADEWLADASTVGLTSGASVPDELVMQVIDHLAERGFDEVAEFTTTDYQETPTGRTVEINGETYHEMSSSVNIAGPVLGPGRYWVEFAIIGPDGNFVWARAPLLEPMWVDYEGTIGLEPASPSGTWPEAMALITSPPPANCFQAIL